MSKANRIADCRALEDLPNIGRSIADDLRSLGISKPVDLSGRDPYDLYDALCRATGVRHDPCLLDVFIAAVHFAEGGAATPWWRYTAERKQALLLRGALDGSKRLDRNARVRRQGLPPHPGPLPTGEREKSGRPRGAKR